MTTTHKKGRAKACAVGEICAGAAGPHPDRPHPDPLPEGEGEGRGEGEGSGGAAAASAPAKPPRKKQGAFHASGAAQRERLFMAGNQLGKTTAGAAEVAFHATGLYPAWWQGRRFARPTVGWASGITAETTRDTVQRLLLGRPRGANLGLVPDRLVEKVASVYTMAGATDTVMV